MRTTLTLDPDVARLLDEEARRQRKTLEEIVNEALRRGLAPQVERATRKRFRIRPHRTTIQPGIVHGSCNALADELEDEAILGKRAFVG